MRRAGILLALFAVTASTTAAQRQPAFDVSAVLSRVADYVTAYYGHAQSILCEETVRLQSLGMDLMPDSTPPRLLRYDLRVAWESATDGGVPEAQVLRTLLSVNNRRPASDEGSERKRRENDNDACMDPKAISPEPLSLFLPENQREYEFTASGHGKVNGRSALILEARERARGPITSTRRDECLSFNLPGRVRSRIWVDEESSEVLRIDEHLSGMYDLDIPPDPTRHLPGASGVLERFDSSVVYRRVAFTDPDERVMLPTSKETVVVFRNVGKDRVRTSQMYRNYRRFITDGRIVQ